MKIELKKWEAADTRALAQICSETDRHFLSDRLPDPYSVTDAEHWISFIQKEEGRAGIFRAIIADGVIVGNISAELKSDVYRRDAEVGYLLSKQYNGQGIMTEALKLLCEEAFRQLDICRLTGLVYAPNIASRRVLKKNGFSLEGILKQAVTKNGETYDLCVYGKLKENSAQ
ncbi:MAG: GNAT family protein [Eubacteriales bacterium]|nr:GNAT family protein [Eubacteriales bacterium]